MSARLGFVCSFFFICRSVSFEGREIVPSSTPTLSIYASLPSHLITWWVLTLALAKAGIFSGIHVMKQ